ncbi:glycosyltransferase family 2 protein [Haematospirillum jordaniae]|uniref:Glycosyl transferase n=1 Tax=Haematospirillum jordaniae TaxID=1549855 RepID=A0A143DF87_9PROT|nr:glycosyltransferase family 2 protein [Haematospirillum jordaniae]AMW35405.1 glycosyl transferase [Haematospirillum jordaniae]NKD45542.1 glycosyltransferase family 2 protein [Haematospirillum jordaniae]NKD56162.1 glycosyltransferase family 2 protein [Haematospirillum jordaniae]NKD58220.1 glycosyltransferase family 2 protein [Haematospirillum jordaniae]NKD66609.1 glycosyltransferase family 2 protein [Haematospirillum jordaniae]
MKELPRLSVLVVVHNEEARLPACLERLTFADEIVVVLDRCTDRSPDIARSAGARMIEGAWPVEGDRRNAGIEACRGDWILEVDADEHVSPALAAEVRAVIASSLFDWHVIPVDNYIGTRLVRHGWGSSFGKAGCPALFRRGVKIWGRQRVHPALQWSGARGPALTIPLVHYVDRNISDMLHRLDRYTSARAADLRESGQAGSLAGAIRSALSRFLRVYLFRKGYREGRMGLVVALCTALYPLLSYIKAMEETEEV